jgi:hypothetical protein
MTFIIFLYTGYTTPLSRHVLLPNRPRVFPLIVQYPDSSLFCLCPLTVPLSQPLTLPTILYLLFCSPCAPIFSPGSLPPSFVGMTEGSPKMFRSPIGYGSGCCNTVCTVNAFHCRYPPHCYTRCRGPFSQRLSLLIYSPCRYIRCRTPFPAAVSYYKFAIFTYHFPLIT